MQHAAGSCNGFEGMNIEGPREVSVIEYPTNTPSKSLHFYRVCTILAPPETPFCERLSLHFFRLPLQVRFITDGFVKSRLCERSEAIS
jgi:hypothetical protein